MTDTNSNLTIQQQKSRTFLRLMVHVIILIISASGIWEGISSFSNHDSTKMWTSSIFEIIFLIVLLAFLLYSAFQTYIEFRWLFSDNPVVEITEEGVWKYSTTDGTLYPWEGLKKYRFLYSGDLIEFYTESDEVIFTLNLRRSKRQERTAIKDCLNQHITNLNHANKPWSKN